MNFMENKKKFVDVNSQKNIQIEIGENYAIRMTGPTTRVGTYELDLEALK